MPSPLPDPLPIDAGSVAPQSTGEPPAAATRIPRKPLRFRPRRHRLRRKQRRKRRIVLPALLFLATCASTFFAGAVNLFPLGEIPPADLQGGFSVERLPIEAHPELWRLDFDVPNVIIDLWPRSGLLYAVAVMGILLAHEMGHFLQAVRYRVPASLPYFLPMPISPTGTMGAVIAMSGRGANRRQLFDIGLTGPWAGLAIAVPLAIVGVMQANVQPSDLPGWYLADPLILQGLQRWLRPELGEDWTLVGNPFLLASWFGFLLTGLNMLPVGQLDGGHVAYAVLGRKAHWLAYAVVAAAAAFVFFDEAWGWILMIVMLLVIGIRHPPTADDAAPLGWFRRVIGIASLAIPILCLAPRPIDYREFEPEPLVEYDAQLSTSKQRLSIAQTVNQPFDFVQHVVKVEARPNGGG